MRKQLQFWDNQRHHPVWKTLSAEDQEKVTALLARILSQVVKIPTPHPIQEKTHEPS